MMSFKTCLVVILFIAFSAVMALPARAQKGQDPLAGTWIGNGSSGKMQLQFTKIRSGHYRVRYGILGQPPAPASLLKSTSDVVKTGLSSYQFSRPENTPESEGLRVKLRLENETLMAEFGYIDRGKLFRTKHFIFKRLADKISIENTRRSKG